MDAFSLAFVSRNVNRYVPDHIGSYSVAKMDLKISDIYSNTTPIQKKIDNTFIKIIKVFFIVTLMICLSKY